MRTGDGDLDCSLDMPLPFHFGEIGFRFRGGWLGPTVAWLDRVTGCLAAQKFDHIRKRMHAIHINAFDDGCLFRILNWDNQLPAISTFGFKSRMTVLKRPHFASASNLFRKRQGNCTAQRLWQVCGHRYRLDAPYNAGLEPENSPLVGEAQRPDTIRIQRPLKQRGNILPGHGAVAE